MIAVRHTFKHPILILVKFTNGEKRWLKAKPYRKFETIVSYFSRRNDVSWCRIHYRDPNGFVGKKIAYCGRHRNGGYYSQLY